ncbi:MAG: NADH-quinone oxidoreductase subunit N [Planctomycetota bacterium]|nr:MAG: NADH-quinone oxidoreductase subunit N [Planctomycetota bacterium]
MSEKLALLHPEMVLFAATCVVMVLGLARSAVWRSACAWLTGGALAAAFVLALRSPVTDGLFPHFLAYTKAMIAGVALLILPVMSGTVDRWYERRVAKGAAFDALRVTRGEFYAFFLLSVTGVMLCATADDLIWLFLALELTSLPTYIMVAISTPRVRAQEAGVKYFFLGALAAATFLYGFAMLFGATGSTSLDAITIQFRGEGLSTIATLGLVMALVGVSFKIAAAPMHFYTADVYQGAASPVSAFLAFMPKAAGLIVLIQLLATVGWSWGEAGDALPDAIRVALWVIATLTMTIGNTLALLQSSAKRLLAYSSIAHSGYMLVGLIAGPGGTVARNGLAAAMFYLLCYGVMNLGAFAVLASLEVRGRDGEPAEADAIDDLRGLFRVRPGLAWAMTLCALSLLGLPPLLGFWGKLVLFTSAIGAGEIGLVVVMGLNSAVAAFYYLRLVRASMLDERDPDAERPIVTEALGRRLAAGLSAAGVVGVVVFASTLQSASHAAATPNPRYDEFLKVEAPARQSPPAATPTARHN